MLWALHLCFLAIQTLEKRILGFKVLIPDHDEGSSSHQRREESAYLRQIVGEVHHRPLSFRLLLPLQQLQPKVFRARIAVLSLIRLRQAVRVQVRFEGVIARLEEKVIVDLIGLLVGEDLLYRNAAPRQLLCL